MHLDSRSPFRSAALTWQPRPGRWTLTVACKVTYDLLPDRCRLADAQEDLNEDDNYWNDDPRRSLHGPRDLIPQKPRADVVLVGHAFAPHGNPVRSLTARLRVGDIDKAIEVFADRAWTMAGTLQEGPPFAKMPLRYERAAHGFDNPVGMRFDAPPNASGAIPVPNLQPTGHILAGPADRFRPVGLGPIAPTWPERRRKLPRAVSDPSAAFWRDQPMPEGLDPAFFNVSPPDQQLDALAADERIALDCLHAAHPSLVTRLPGAAPRALVERGGAGAIPLALRADTLWIDTTRGICTLTWRGQLPIERPDQVARIVVDLDNNGGSREPARNDMDMALETQAPRASFVPALPFVHQALGDNGPHSHPAAAQVAPPQPAPPPVQPPPIQPPAPMAVAPPPLMSPMDSPPSAPRAAPARSARAAAARPQVASLAALKEQGKANGAAALSAAGASDAAAGAQPSGRHGALGSGRAPGGPVIEVLWLDPSCAERVRRHPEWQKLLAPRNGKRGAAAEVPPEIKDRRDITQVITRGAPGGEEQVPEALSRAVGEDGTFTPPLVLMEGELELAFDELEALKATIAALSPFLPGDRKLQETVDAVSALLKTPSLGGAGDVAARLTAMLREAFAQSNRSLPAQFLEAQTDKILLSQRHYQQRSIRGRSCARGALLTGEAQPQRPQPRAPVYVPSEATRELPMFQRLPVRLIAEVCMKLDQYESHSYALRALALGRVLPGFPGELPLGR